MGFLRQILFRLQMIHLRIYLKHIIYLIFKFLDIEFLRCKFPCEIPSQICFLNLKSAYFLKWFVFVSKSIPNVLKYLFLISDILKWNSSVAQSISNFVLEMHHMFFNLFFLNKLRDGIFVANSSLFYFNLRWNFFVSDSLHNFHFL